MTTNNIPKDYNHKSEVEWQNKWQKNDLYRFSDDGIHPIYIIDTPPPYPTGSIHMGHVLNWFYMDLIARYKRMRGFNVLFPQGWDCHGLPTEVKVEETHNIKKSDVPREEFRRMCIELTQKNIKMMKAQMQSLGFSQDWSQEFVTMTPQYKRKTQLSFLKMYNQGLIYQAIHPVNWCPRCETAIAFAEVEYHENETYLNYLEFSETRGGEKILIATTRPELLSACVAVTVHPEDERYHNLAGKYLEIPLYNREVKVITDEDVDPEFGTGAVMICTFGDKTDVSWVNRHDLDVIEAIDDKGIMMEVAGKYAGCTLEECKDDITRDLKAQGYLVKQEKVNQNLGLCWRCKTPIEILVKKQWFVAVNQLVKEIKETTNQMRWMPEHMKTRLLNWTGSMDWDWCISRQRIFATPIPVWYCTKCGKVQLPRAEDLPVDPTEENPKSQCECGSEEFKGEDDVLDTWMDSSITPLIIAGWPENYHKLYPSSLRQQGHDIIRTWAFYTILRCKALTGEAPFDEVVVNGMVFGDDGHKMSKSRGNVISPEEVIREFGADALRLWAANSVPGSDVPFAWKDVKHGYKFLRKFWNAFRFINLHISNFHPSISEDEIFDYLQPLDSWILSKFYHMLDGVTRALDNYNFALAINLIQSFIWHDFCDDYIESVKHRIYRQADDAKNHSHIAAKHTLKTVLSLSLILLSPFTPHFTEEVYQHLSGKESIHKEDWPHIKTQFINEGIEMEGDLGIQVIGDLRRFKSASGLPLNHPLKVVNLYTSSPESFQMLERLKDDIKGTMHIQQFQILRGKPDVKEKVVQITPVMAKIGPEFKKDAPEIVKYLKSVPPHEIAKKIENEGKIDINGHEITSDHLKTTKELLGKTGEKVEILQVENFDVVLEIVV